MNARHCNDMMRHQKNMHIMRTMKECVKPMWLLPNVVSIESALLVPNFAMISSYPHF